MRKSEATSKANIQSIKNKIQALDLKIKGMDIDHFYEQVNSLTTALSEHGMVMTDTMHHLFNTYKVFQDNEFQEYHTEIDLKVICEEVVFSNYMENYLTKDDLVEYNCCKLDENIQWLSLSGTKQEILLLIAEVNW